jgi:LDH2 family malate/lactate/ureidoglycolate dehydrogenase
MGMVTGCMAMQTAIKKAKSCGVGYVGVRNSAHVGALGYYANLAAEQDMLGVAMTNTNPQVNIPEAAGRVVPNNPIAFAAPRGTGPGILLDISMSRVSVGKITAAAAAGEQIPPDWMVDVQGRPTTDPSAFWQGGALLPIGGHKGYGLSLMVEVFTAVLTGSAVASQVKTWVLEEHLSEPTGHGHAFLALDIEPMMPRAQFNARLDRLTQEIRQAPKAPGAARIYLPGEMEWERRQEALLKGIPLPPAVIDSLDGLAEDVGISRVQRVV